MRRSLRKVGLPFRSPLTLAVACSLFAAPLVVPAQARAAAPAASAEELYDDGRKAYRLGDFQTAVDKWQSAYDVSDNGLLLYNISLAYKGLYSISGDVGDLRRSRAVLDNFIKVAKANPDIDVDDAPERLVELDEMIAEIQAAEAADKPPPPADVVPIGQLRDDPGPDPGRKLRLAGIGTMVGGGAILLAGVGLAAVYAVRSSEFGSALARENTRFDEMGCSTPLSGECAQLQINIDTARENGNKANATAVGLGVGVGALGAVALVAGGLVFNEGNKRTKQWERRFESFRVAPTMGRTRAGLSLSGRF